jgi:hypothetical protein
MLQHQVELEEDDFLVSNDSGTYSCLKRGSVLFMMMNYKAKEKTILTSWAKKGHKPSWHTRYTSPEGKRYSKSFPSKAEAKKYLLDSIMRVWGEELKRLDLVKTYTATLL